VITNAKSARALMLSVIYFSIPLTRLDYSDSPGKIKPLLAFGVKIGRREINPNIKKCLY
jgi:hypothetical protein